MIATLYALVLWYNLGVLAYFLSLNSLYLLLLTLAAWRLTVVKLRAGVRICADKECAFVPPVAIITPAFNEAVTIVENIESLLRVDYPDYEVVVVNDGSSDGTLSAIKEHFGLFPVDRTPDAFIPCGRIRGVYASARDPRLVVVDKDNGGGKADALNAGINYARARLFCAIDADCVIERNALTKLVRPFLERDAKTVGVGGIVRIANGCTVENGQVVSARLPRSSLAALQVIEYIRAFLCGRTGWSTINTLLIISGAFGLFERKAVVEAGGYRKDLIGEDMELVVRLHRVMRDRNRAYRMVFIPDPVCWTQAPETLKVLSAQRRRWQKGTLETLWAHRRMIGNPSYGMIGLVGMPYLMIYEAFGPLIEMSGYIVVLACGAAGWVDPVFVYLLLLIAFLFGVLLSLFSLLLEEFTVKRYESSRDMFRLFLLAVYENFGYRQINTWWRFVATLELWFNKKKAWGDMPRTSFSGQGGKK